MRKSSLIAATILVAAVVAILALSVIIGSHPCAWSDRASCDAWWTAPGKPTAWWGDRVIRPMWAGVPSQFGLGWLDTNFGSGAFFFALDGLLVVIAVPLVLTHRARRNWGRTASTLAKNILVLGKEFRSLDYALGYTDEIEGAMTLMGSSVQAFPALEGALYEGMPIILRIKRRLVYLTSTIPNESTEHDIREQHTKLLDDIEELERRIKPYRRGLERLVRSDTFKGR